MALRNKSGLLWLHTMCICRVIWIRQ